MGHGYLLLGWLVAVFPSARATVMSDADVVAAFVADPGGRLVWSVPPDRTAELCGDALAALGGPADGPAESALWFTLARVYSWYGDQDGALDALTEAVEAHPDNVRARVLHAALVCHHRKDNSAAEAVARNYPADARAVAVWARCWPADGAKLAARAVELAGTDPEAAAIAAQVRGDHDFAAGRFRDAVTAYDRAFRTVDRATWLVSATGLYANRGLAHLELGDTARALADLARAGRAAPAERRISRGVWLAHVRAGDFSAALAAAEGHRKAHPGDGYGKVMRAAALTRLARTDDALKELADALPDVHVLAERAAAHHLKGDRAAAGKCLDAALAQDPTYPPAVLGKTALAATDPNPARPAAPPVVIANGVNYTVVWGSADLAGGLALPGPDSRMYLAPTGEPSDTRSAPAVVARMLDRADAKDYPQAAALAADALCNPRVAPCYRDHLLGALAAYKAGKPFAVPPGLLGVVYQPAVPPR